MHHIGAIAACAPSINRFDLRTKAVSMDYLNKVIWACPIAACPGSQCAQSCCACLECCNWGTLCLLCIGGCYDNLKPLYDNAHRYTQNAHEDDIISLLWTKRGDGNTTQAPVFMSSQAQFPQSGNEKKSSSAASFIAPVPGNLGDEGRLRGFPLKSRVVEERLQGFPPKSRVVETKLGDEEPIESGTT